MCLPSRQCLRLARLSLALLLAAGAACGGTTSEPKTEPVEDRKPVRVAIVTAPPSSGQVGSGGGEFVVRVEDAQGRGVPNVRVEFRSQTNTPFFGLNPLDATTDSMGVARTTVAFGPAAGAGGVMATAAGVTDPALVSITLTPGSRVVVFTTPSSFRLYGPGDEVSFKAWISDAMLNVLPDTAFAFVISDSTLVSVTAPSVPGGTGTIRALKGSGTALIRSSWVTGPMGAGLAMSVTVNTMPRLACAGVGTPQVIAQGALVTAAGSTFCLDSSTAGGEYSLIVYNESADGATTLGTSVTAYNVEPDLNRALMPSERLPQLARSATLRRTAPARQLDLGFHERLLRRTRSLRQLFAPARAARSRATSQPMGRLSGPRFSYSGGGAAPAVPAVDDLLALNVADSSCTGADMRTFRVEAVGSKAIVLADTGNPANGFTRADYQRFAARFDTLVYPVDRDAFGEPSDIDGNAHIAILFTRAVNELTPAGSGAFVGGFFHPRDLFPRSATSGRSGCETSNEGEMFYMMVPDPLGTVNDNIFSRGMVDTLTTGVLAHELQHLINASRRMYVNTAAQDFEELWLNEGLSHVAEELLYFRESGYAPRARLAAQNLVDTREHWETWVADDASNFVRFYLYLLDAANHSPIGTGDALETRGATWAFLRYAVDHAFASDAGVWQRFTNSTTTGLGTLNAALQRDPAPLLRDFAVANLAAPLVEDRYRHPSWHYADIFTQIFVGEGYPLPVKVLKEATTAAVSVRGGSASYYRFAVLPGTQALLRFGTADAPPNSALRFLVVRTR